MPGHWEVDGNGVSLLHTVGLEDVGKTARLAEELAIADLSAFTGLIGFVDDGGLKPSPNVRNFELRDDIYLLWVFEGPTINTVVRSIQATFREPNDITSCETAGSHGLERAIPVQKFASTL